MHKLKAPAHLEALLEPLLVLWLEGLKVLDLGRGPAVKARVRFEHAVDMVVLVLQVSLSLKSSGVVRGGILCTWEKRRAFCELC